jgi:hypothetical protein
MESPDFAKDENQIACAPWKLTGSGYILLYRFTKAFVAQHGFLADFQKEKFRTIKLLQLALTTNCYLFPGFFHSTRKRCSRFRKFMSPLKAA